MRVGSLRSLALDISAFAFALALGLLGMAAVFRSDIPNHHSATHCVGASVVLGYLAVAAAAVFVLLPAPSIERRAPLPAATLTASARRRS